MCLDRVFKSKPAKTGYFYKSFELSPWDDRIHPWMFAPPNLGDGYERGVWYPARAMPVRADNSQPYTSGFHGFVRRKDAIDWNGSARGVFRVQYRGAHTKGLQDGRKTVVASEIRIPKKRRKS